MKITDISILILGGLETMGAFFTIMKLYTTHQPLMINPSTAHDKFYNFVTKHDFLQIVKDEIMQGKLQYPLMNFDIRYTFIKIFVILKKDFDKAQGKPEGWEFAKDDEEKHCREKKVKWEYKEVVRLPKPILPIQRDNVTIWDNRFGVIPIQQYEMDPHKIGLTDEQIIAMFNGLKDSFLYDYAYGEYFKNYLPDLYEKIHEYYLSYILNDTSDNCGGIGYYRWCYERKDDTCGLYSDIKNWINNIIEWELRRRFQPLIDRYWINGVDTLGVFTPTKVIPTEQEPEPNEVGASWCDDNGKWYIFLVTDCYHQAHTQAR